MTLVNICFKCWQHKKKHSARISDKSPRRLYNAASFFRFIPSWWWGWHFGPCLMGGKRNLGQRWEPTKQAHSSSSTVTVEPLSPDKRVQRAIKRRPRGPIYHCGWTTEWNCTILNMCECFLLTRERRRSQGWQDNYKSLCESRSMWNQPSRRQRRKKKLSERSSQFREKNREDRLVHERDHRL